MIGMFVKSVLLRRGGVCLLAVVGLLACGSNGSRPVPTSGSEGKDADASADWFVDQAARVGLDFIHFNGMSGKFYQPEIAAPGVGMFDYDNDGDLDLAAGGILFRNEGNDHNWLKLKLWFRCRWCRFFISL